MSDDVASSHQATAQFQPVSGETPRQALSAMGSAASSLLDPKAFAQLTIEHIRELLGCEGVALYWWNAGEEVLMPLAHDDPHAPAPIPVFYPGQGMIGLAFARRIPVTIEDYKQLTDPITWELQQGVEDGVAVPLLLGDEPHGVLLGLWYHPHPVTAQEVRLLRLIGAQVTPALETMRLLAESERQRVEAEVLAELMRQGTAQNDFERVVALVTEYASRLLEADFGMVALRGADGSYTWHGSWGNRVEDWRDMLGVSGEGERRGILATERSLVVSSLGDNPAYALDEQPQSKSTGQRTGLVTPLRHLDHFLGSLVLGWNGNITLTQAQISVAERLATYATMLIVSARSVQFLATNEQLLRALISNAPVILFALDQSGVITLSEGRGLAAIGRQRGEGVGHTVFERYRDYPDVLDHTRRALAGEAHTALYRINGAMLETRYVMVQEGGIDGVIGVATDVTERVRAEELTRHQALHDALTDLPNRLLLRDRLEQAMVAARLVGHDVALLLLDLDNFKEINDTLGHHFGDLLLVEVAHRLQTIVQPGHTVARLSGDEFAILLPRGNEGIARSLAQEIARVLNRPILVEGHTLQAEASIGGAIGPLHGDDASTLLRHADVAMYAAKRARIGYALYTTAQDPHSAERLALIGDLRRAIAQSELMLHYQPMVDLRTRQVQGVEALVRWQHPQHGLLAPGQFIPLAEQNGLIRPMTQLILVTAIEQVKLWQEAGLALNMSINLSQWDLLDDELPQLIAVVLDSFGLSPERLCLELTEGTVMSDTTRALQVLTRLAALGVQIAIDDFGTGYSSLAYLKRLPVNVIKIDQSFLRSLAQDAADRTIVRATINMGHELGLKIVSEGVEDAATLSLLVEMGCDIAQGYFLGRPVPADELEHQLRMWPEGQSWE